MLMVNVENYIHCTTPSLKKIFVLLCQVHSGNNAELAPDFYIAVECTENILKLCEPLLFFVCMHLFCRIVFIFYLIFRFRYIPNIICFILDFVLQALL